MFAIIKTGGKQYKVSPSLKIKIEKIDVEQGQEAIFDQVLLVADDKKEIKIGAPLVKGAKVKAKVLRHSKAKKIIVFKYKSKKRYKKKMGHRQPFTEVEILDIAILPPS